MTCRAAFFQMDSNSFCLLAMNTMKWKGDIFSCVRTDRPPTCQLRARCDPPLPSPAPVLPRLLLAVGSGRPGGFAAPRTLGERLRLASEQGSSLSLVLRRLLPSGCSFPHRAGMPRATGSSCFFPSLTFRSTGRGCCWCCSRAFCWNRFRYFGMCVLAN